MTQTAPRSLIILLVTTITVALAFAFWHKTTTHTMPASGTPARDSTPAGLAEQQHGSDRPDSPSRAAVTPEVAIHHQALAHEISVVSWDGKAISDSGLFSARFGRPIELVASADDGGIITTPLSSTDAADAKGVILAPGFAPGYLDIPSTPGRSTVTLLAGLNLRVETFLDGLPQAGILVRLASGAVPPTLPVGTSQYLPNDEGGLITWSTSDSDGWASFDSLPSGTYLIRAFKDHCVMKHGRSVEVGIPQATTARLDLLRLYACVLDLGEHPLDLKFNVGSLDVDSESSLKLRGTFPEAHMWLAGTYSNHSDRQITLTYTIPSLGVRRTATAHLTLISDVRTEQPHIASEQSIGIAGTAILRVSCGDRQLKGLRIPLRRGDGDTTFALSGKPRLLAPGIYHIDVAALPHVEFENGTLQIKPEQSVELSGTVQDDVFAVQLSLRHADIVVRSCSLTLEQSDTRPQVHVHYPERWYFVSDRNLSIRVTRHGMPDRTLTVDASLLRASHGDVMVIDL